MSLTKGLYKNLLGDFLALKLFPGDPILDPPNFRDIKKYATEFFLIGVGGPVGGGRVFF